MVGTQYLGIEIGGTKLQLGVGPGDGTLRGLWRDRVDPVRGADGIREQILRGIPELLQKAQLDRQELLAAGIGFGGPTDDATHTVIRSHQIAGWDNFPLAAWVSDIVGLPAVLGNDADVAGLGEALHGAGKGLSPMVYMTIGSGIGGGLILDGKIYRGTGRGGAEIGHLRVPHPAMPAEAGVPLEKIASGWGIENEYARATGTRHTVVEIARKAGQGEQQARQALHGACLAISQALCQVIALLCPRRIVIGGGVSLLGEELLFHPVRQLVAAHVFAPFAGLTEIVPAALGEEVVLHGAIALVREQVHGGTA